MPEYYRHLGADNTYIINEMQLTEGYVAHKRVFCFLFNLPLLLIKPTVC